MDTDLKRGPIDADIFISHTHWDHIMGFPMFTPLFVSTTKLRIRGPVSYEEDTLESIIGTQLSYRYWPVRLNELAARDENERVFCFLQGADLLIHDTQYSSDEYEADKIGWGHSSYEHASDAAQKAGVKKLVFFHHDPRRTDQQLAAIESEYRARMAKTGVEIFMAREGQRIEA
jgi:ribonuclease BN (tRNA processing enzyme)